MNKQETIKEQNNDMVENNSSQMDKENFSHIPVVMSGRVLYQALHNSCTFESSSYTMSIHVTREGAEKAVRESKLIEYKRWREYAELDKLKRLYKQYKNTNLVYSDELNCLIENAKACPFGWDMSWGVQEIIVQE